MGANFDEPRAAGLDELKSETEESDHSCARVSFGYARYDSHAPKIIDRPARLTARRVNGA